METRRCKCCDQIKPLSEFGDFGVRKRSMCKACDPKLKRMLLPSNDVGGIADMLRYIQQLEIQANETKGKLEQTQQGLNEVKQQNTALSLGLAEIPRLMTQNNARLLEKLDLIESVSNTQYHDINDMIKNIVVDITGLKQVTGSFEGRLDQIINSIALIQEQNKELNQLVTERVNEACQLVIPTPITSPVTSTVNSPKIITPTYGPKIITPSGPKISTHSGGSSPSGSGTTTPSKRTNKILPPEQYATLTMDQLVKERKRIADRKSKANVKGDTAKFALESHYHDLINEIIAQRERRFN